MVSVGGWKVGISLTDGTLADQIQSITVEGAKSTITMTTPYCYELFGNYGCDYTSWLGHRDNADDEAFVVKGTAVDGSPINFVWPDGEISDQIPCIPDVYVPRLNSCKIEYMAITKRGDLRVRFTVPPDTAGRSTHIRIRIIDPVTQAFLMQYRINPPYEIVRKDGTIIPDQIQFVIPGEYAGYPARIGYRAYAPHTTYPETGDVMTRVVTWFTLPELVE